MVNKKRLIKLTCDLVRIDSQNPPGDEKTIAAFVQKYLVRLGLKTRSVEFSPGRTNVLAYFGGKRHKKSLLITPHLDTVPAGNSWKRNPFLAHKEGRRLYGLGATDCKGNLAVCLEALRSLVEEKARLDYELVFAATADEESGSGLGLIPLLEKNILKPSAALVLDADDFEIVFTQKGLLHLKLVIEGKKAHGAYPWLGDNAIARAVEILYGLARARLSSARNRYLRAATLNIGTIRGGDKVNVVADRCECELDLRFLPGTAPETMLKKIRQAAQKHAGRFKLEIESLQTPYAIEKSHPLIKYLRQAMLKVKIKPVLTGSEGATVITFFQHKNIPAVATGFGSAGCAHMADEYVQADNLYKGTQVLVEFLKSYRFD